MTHWETLWTFETRNVTVLCQVTPCEDDPADSFAYDGCEEEVNDIREGRIGWFDARVVVFKAGAEVGADYLGCCAYTNAIDFVRGEGRNGYFRDMVKSALSNARETLAKLAA